MAEHPPPLSMLTSGGPARADHVWAVMAEAVATPVSQSGTGEGDILVLRLEGKAQPEEP